MNEAEPLLDPLDMLDAQERAAFLADSLLGALDDVIEEYEVSDQAAEAQASFTGRLKNMFDVVAGRQAEKDTQSLELLRSFAARLGEVACNHPHLTGAFDEQELPWKQHEDDAHDHTGQDKKTKKKKKQFAR